VANVIVTKTSQPVCCHTSGCFLGGNSNTFLIPTGFLGLQGFLCRIIRRFFFFFLGEHLISCHDLIQIWSHNYAIRGRKRDGAKGKVSVAGLRLCSKICKEVPIPVPIRPCSKNILRGMLPRSMHQPRTQAWGYRPANYPNKALGQRAHPIPHIYVEYHPQVASGIKECQRQRCPHLS
jgi:hypothetical protein